MVVRSLVKKILRRFTSDRNTLFDGDDKLFKELVNSIKVYGEYGCGASTKYILLNTFADVISVDTSKEWVSKVTKETLAYKNRLNLKHLFLGETKHWGYPIDYSRESSFSLYTDYIWQQKKKPELVLVDGRFRVCCFLSSLKFADEGTKIIFDDYVNRPHYHIVEKFLQPLQTYKRQALFIIPEKDSIDLDELDNAISLYRNVMD